MAIEKLKPDFQFDEERIKKLYEIVPEAFADGKINWHSLQEALGHYKEDDDVDSEHYGLFWPGKREARRKSASPSTGTLIPANDFSSKAIHSDNLFIEGENLEVLKLLQKAYADKIKMIYIDPPYNTGNDFIYDDNFSETVEDYMRRTGQLDEDSKPLATNSRVDGRFHSKWLSMMYPRLRLARNLLKEDGVIFVSIDDNEVANLKLLMNEIFGEENFLGQFVINSTPNARDYGHIGKMHEYCLFYGKNSTLTETYHLEDKDKKFKYSDDIGDYNIHPLYNSNVAFTNINRPNLYYPFYLNLDNNIEEDFYEISLKPFKNSVEIFPPKSVKDNIQFVWRWGKDKSASEMNVNIIGYKISDDEYRIVQKMRTTEKVVRSLLLEKEFSSRRGTSDLEKLFGKKTFSFPKPLELIKTFIKVGSTDGDTILDFFSGSGTLAQAVLELNAESAETRNFITVQLPVKTKFEINTEIKDLENISDITEARIEKSIIQCRKINSEKDFSYKKFRLSTSSFKIWQDYLGSDITALEKLLSENSNPLISDWEIDNLLSERGRSTKSKKNRVKDKIY
ncbi:site-specific DNA-methyltransferase [Chryseobacterium mulctrae]|uniref:site-specific DNA-methyltransferase n=1 Tax=Chryseobacterium mulctrae TaxID=2576777 RepID=UPI001115D52C|nr:site-specific DNA-methyltransferase [Chryseobacterium mulctrae]